MAKSLADTRGPVIAATDYVRLFAEQIEYIVGNADDQVIFVDDTLTGLPNQARSLPPDIYFGFNLDWQVISLAYDLGMRGQKTA